MPLVAKAVLTAILTTGLTIRVINRCRFVSPAGTRRSLACTTTAANAVSMTDHLAPITSPALTIRARVTATVTGPTKAIAVAMNGATVQNAMTAPNGRIGRNVSSIAQIVHQIVHQIAQTDPNDWIAGIGQTGPSAANRALIVTGPSASNDHSRKAMCATSSRGPRAAYRAAATAHRLIVCRVRLTTSSPSFCADRSAGRAAKIRTKPFLPLRRP